MLATKSLAVNSAWRSFKLHVLKQSIGRNARAMSGGKDAPAVPRPSASILLVSPTNTLLLLRRVQTSSSFPSAHVFPGGNLDEQDGAIPAIDHPDRHRDGNVYRTGALRECFEECGILLARNNEGQMLEVDDAVRDEGRKAIHENKIKFLEWVEEQGGHIDTDGLIPFTRWITPQNIPRRFTTQMYIYFLPLSLRNGRISSMTSSKQDAIIPAPTHDGGAEHTAARFQSCQEWISQAQSGNIILFPPQFFLLYMLSRIFKEDTRDNETLQKQRDELRSFVHTSTPPWTEKCISPQHLLKLDQDGRQALNLEKPGFEVAGSSRAGDFEHVVLAHFKKEGPRNLEVCKKQEVFDMARKQKRYSQKGLKL